VRVRTRSQAARTSDSRPGGERPTDRLTDARRKAGWSGVVFALLLIASLVLMQRLPARTAGVFPGPVAVVSYLAAVGLLVSVTFHPAILLVFPAWVLMVSIVLLVHRPTGVTP
jgi:hypothetical protein